MKRTIALFLAIALVAVPSCKNNRGQKAKEQTKTTTENIDFNNKAQVASELVKVEVQNLIESTAKMKPAPFASAKQDGRITLTAKEKLVKPDYLLDPAVVKGLVVFPQKYRAVSMLAVDKAIADLYEVPGNEYGNAIFAVLTELGDEAITTFASMPWIDFETSKDAMKTLAEDEYNAGRQCYFWEGVTALIVEQVYIISSNVDKFMPMFTDQTAADFTYNFICLHDGLTSLVAQNPEMESLNKSLEVLYKIDAISVKQLRSQLLEVKDEIVAVRESLLK